MQGRHIKGSVLGVRVVGQKDHTVRTMYSVGVLMARSIPPEMHVGPSTPPTPKCREPRVMELRRIASQVAESCFLMQRWTSESLQKCAPGRAERLFYLEAFESAAKYVDFCKKLRHDSFFTEAFLPTLVDRA